MDVGVVGDGCMYDVLKKKVMLVFKEKIGKEPVTSHLNGMKLGGSTN